MPITGTVKQVEPCIIGDPNDPICIPLDLGNVSWTLISLDIENEEMEIEVTASEKTDYDTGEKDVEGKPIWACRPTTTEEKETLLEHARNYSLERMSKEALYALSKSPRLKNPFKKK